jgi:hypothetical protein
VNDSGSKESHPWAEGMGSFSPRNRYGPVWIWTLTAPGGVVGDFELPLGGLISRNGQLQAGRLNLHRVREFGVGSDEFGEKEKTQETGEESRRRFYSKLQAPNSELFQGAGTIST